MSVLHIIPSPLRGEGRVRVAWTTHDFFNQIRLESFLSDHNLLLNDAAPLLIATKILAEHKQPIALAHHYVAALDAVWHGMGLASQVCQKKPTQKWKLLAQIESELVSSHLADKSFALLKSLKALQKHQKIPQFLAQFSSIEAHYLADLTALELEIFFALAKSGMPVKFVFPLDDQNRGLTLPTSYLAAQIESRHDLSNVEIDFEPVGELFPSRCELYQAAHAVDEAQWIAKKIVELRDTKDIPSIAIAVRTIDAQTSLICDALAQLQVPTSIRRKLRASETNLFKQLLQTVSQDLPKEASLFQYVDLFTPIFPEPLRDVLRGSGSFWNGVQEPVPLHQLIRWLKARFASEWEVEPPCRDASAVEIITLPEAFGRHYDHVIIAGVVHGKIPLALSQDPLLPDEERFEINRLFGRPILRLYDNDPLEESLVPPRQSHEPMWFMGACKAATQSLILTASDVDLCFKEQARSEFFNLAIAAGAYLHERQISAPLKRTEQSIRSTQIDAALFRRRFGPKLGLLPEHPLTPTRLEAIANCRFRAFIEKLLGIDTEPEAGADLDARALGRLAHEVLEAYYKTKDAQKSLLSDLLWEKAKAILDQEPANRLVMQAQIKWLETALQRLVSNLAKHQPVPEVEPKHFELAIGLESGIPIKVGQDTLYFGGIIDRVDEGPAARVVVDYKTSTSAAIDAKVRENEVFYRHFQLPLYVRLLAHTMPDDKAFGAYLVSVRDGTTSSVLGFDKMQDLKDRVLDDGRADGLSAGLSTLLTPVFRGEIAFDQDERCDGCRLKRVCRVAT